jgi:hypothetical protein
MVTRYADKDKESTFDEIFIDNLYINYTTGGDNPLSVTLGRQNLIYGEGFILLEGAPWDGSRAIYHDAIKVSLKRGKTTFDLLGIANNTYDNLFPTAKFYDKDKQYKQLFKDAEGNKWMNDGAENAIGLYVKNAASAGKSFEGYYFLKMESPDPWLPKPSITDAQLEDLTLHTIGGRAVYPFTENLGVVTEWAYQMGSQSDHKQSSYGGYLDVNYKAWPKKSGVATAGVYALSGDDPETADIEGWNPIFSRWPKWSELYIYSTIGPETNGGAGKVAYNSNMLVPNLKYVMDIIPGLNVTLWYHNLSAFQEGLGGGKARGNEFQCWVKMKFNNFFTGHVLYDYFIPGNFYPDGADNAKFIRFELMYTFNSK